MTTIPTALNDKGQQHVTAEIERLGLNWKLDAVFSEIESMNDFCDVLAREVKFETPRGDIYISADMVMIEELDA